MFHPTTEAPHVRRSALATLAALPGKLASLLAGEQTTPPIGYYHRHRKARR